MTYGHLRGHSGFIKAKKYWVNSIDDERQSKCWAQAILVDAHHGGNDERRFILCRSKFK
jgi:hypothetical protein